MPSRRAQPTSRREGTADRRVRRGAARRGAARCGAAHAGPGFTRDREDAMSFDVERLYDLLPAVYRARDAEEGLPLKAVLSVIAEQVAVVEEDLAQLYDDQFIETCAEWVVPYIGDLVDARGLYDLRGAVSQRAQVANTLTYRRRKGTVAVLEQVARDVTGWSAHAVEFFQALATTQHTNHIRPNNLTSPDLRRWEPLERANTPFDTLPRTAEVRRIASRRGRYNVPSVGIYLWRVGAYSLTKLPAYKLAPGVASDRRYRFSPLGNDAPLYNRPETEEQIMQLAGPLNVPMPISRRVLDRDPEDYYGKSLLLFEGAKEVPIESVMVCDLSDWVRKPETKYAIDPVLGRIASPEDRNAPTDLRVTYHYGFGANTGGGEYGRDLSPYPPGQAVETVPSGSPTIQQALDAVRAGGFVEVTDSGRYQETPSINVSAQDRRVEVRARDGRRPSVELGGVLNISGVENTEVTLDGLLISGAALQVATGSGSGLRRLRMRHCTLVPGLSIDEGGAPRSPSAPSLVVGSANVSLEIDRCILGGLRVAEDNHVRITNSIVDATAESGVAYAAQNGQDPGGTLRVENSTIIGKIHTRLMELASNTIFLAELNCERLQQGCVRFSYLPLASHAPRRHRCRPADEAEAARVRPQFSSLRYGHPDYCQLGPFCAAEIRQGADDEAEMGAFHDLYQPQRESNLRLRLEEYLRFGLEAGVFYAS